jgi:hypothetical protein
MNINPTLLKSFAIIVAPLILDAIQKGIPKEKVYEEVFDAATKLGISISDQLNASLGNNLGEGLETVFQTYLNEAMDAFKAGLNNGLDKNELPNPDADV